MHRGIYEWLKQVASSGRTTTYGEIAQIAGYDPSKSLSYRKWVSETLDEISSHEQRQGHPLLSAVVVRKMEPVPGPGFFVLAHRFGLYPDDSRMEDTERQQARYDFHRAELARVHRFWRSHP